MQSRTANRDDTVILVGKIAGLAGRAAGTKIGARIEPDNQQRRNVRAAIGASRCQPECVGLFDLLERYVPGNNW
jgi:hypothetical protein